MCGIAGIFFFQPQVVAESILQSVAGALKHRGPDREGVLIGRQAALCHRRLSIIDLSTAASQPMKDETNRYAVVFNGEIYNFRSLRKQLESSFSFFSNSDTEVILRLFQQHKANAWQRLNGMFSIAILDDAENELFIARDHAGIKPLYYYQDRQKFLFASEPAALLATGLVPSEIDHEALSYYLQLGYFPGRFTPFAHIRKLEPGNAMKISSSGVEIETYWKLEHTHEKSYSFSDPEEELDCLLKRSVERQMISDVPVGAFLSGGIDSSLIVALMHELQGNKIRTFTAGFEGMGYYDERRFARAIAEEFKTDHQEFSISESPEALLPRIVSAFGEPFADSSAIPTYCLAELTSRHVKVALSGTGGDEIFGGYRKYMAAHWASAYISLPGSVRKTIRKTVSLLPASRKSLWQERALLLQRFSDLTPQIPPNLQLNAIFSQEEVEQLTGLKCRPAHAFFQPVQGTIVENMMQFDYQIFLPEDLLVKEDRCTMAFGLESRVPYLDREVVEFMHRLPLRYKVSRTSTKQLFRKVAAKYLPNTILRRPKHGFGSPASEWLRKEMKSFTQQVILSSHFFPNSNLLERKWQEHQSGARDNNRALWAILMLELWKRWLEERV